MAFHSAWKTFRTQFGRTLASLKRHHDLLADEKITATILEIRDLDQPVQPLEDKLDGMSRRLEGIHISVDESAILRQKQQLNDKRRLVLTSLDPPDYHNDLENTSKERGVGSSGNWILNNDTFKEWVEMAGVENRTLYLNGIPGTGRYVVLTFKRKLC